MADIALIFHWSPGVMGEMTIEELMGWHQRALARIPQPES